MAAETTPQTLNESDDFMLTPSDSSSSSGAGNFRAPAHERAITCKTLICFLQSLVGEVVTIEQRNDDRITGRLKHVDAFMNCQLHGGVVVKRPVGYLSEEYESYEVNEYLVNGTKVRYVTFGEEIGDPITRMEGQLSQHQKDQESRRTAGVKRQERPWHKNKDKKMNTMRQGNREAAAVDIPN
jgi:small nuclear ribonucleoprotein (snRNP)-like protein